MARTPKRPTRPDHEQHKRDALVAAVQQFNERDFYECHETIEVVWLEEPGDDVLFLQGLIQAAAAFHNALRGKWGGTERLLQASLDKLEPYGNEHLDVNLSALCQELRAARRHALELAKRGGTWDEAWLPKIELKTA